MLFESRDDHSVVCARKHAHRVYWSCLLVVFIGRVYWWALVPAMVSLTILCLSPHLEARASACSLHAGGILDLYHPHAVVNIRTSETRSLAVWWESNGARRVYFRLGNELCSCRGGHTPRVYNSHNYVLMSSQGEARSRS